MTTPKITEFADPPVYRRHFPWEIFPDPDRFDGEKVFCATGTGGGVDPHCKPSQSSTSRFIVETPEELSAAVTKQAIADAELWQNVPKHIKDVRIGSYKDEMELAAPVLNRIHAEVIKVSNKLERLQKKDDKLSAEMSAIFKKYPNVDYDKIPEARAKFQECYESSKKLIIEQHKAASGFWDLLRKHSTIDYDSSSGVGGTIEHLPVLDKVHFHASQTQWVNKTHSRMIEEFANDLSGVLGRAHEQTMKIVDFQDIPLNQKQRANCSHGGTRINLCVSDGKYTIAHEFGHAIEKHYVAKRLVEGFLLSRIGDEKPKHMGLGYDADEVGWEDDFGKSNSNPRYVGKSYKGGSATEITSMGLQKLFEDPIHFAKSDPEYFKLTIGILNGKLL